MLVRASIASVRESPPQYPQRKRRSSDMPRRSQALTPVVGIAAETTLTGISHLYKQEEMDTEVSS